MKLDRKKIPVVVVAIAAVALGAWTLWNSRHATPKNRVIVHGTIEATTSDLAFQVGGRIAEISVEEGSLVRAGETIARLDDRDYRHEFTLAKATLHAAEARHSELLAGSRPQEIRAAEENLQRARLEMENKKKTAERIAALYQEQLASTEDRDNSETAYTTAKAAFEQAKEQADLVRIGPRKETIAAARAQEAQSRASVRIAETRLHYTNLSAPFAGVVLVKAAEVGEVVSPGTTVATLADLDHPWIRAYISETDLGRVKLGQRVSVTTDAYPGKTYAGRVSFIASEAEFTPKSVQTEKERINQVYRIKADLENHGRELKPGMPADGQIHLDERAP